MSFRDVIRDDEEFEQLTLEIEDLLNKINQSTNKIKKATTSILSTNKDTSEFRNQLNELIKITSKQVIELNLSKKIKVLESLKNLNFSFKINKLNKNIEIILNEYQSAVTNCLKKQKQFIQNVKKNNNYKEPKLIYQEEANEEDSLLLPLTNHTSSKNNNKQQLLNMEYNSQLENEIEFNTRIITEREEDIKEIESNIRDLNQIFKELHYLTIEQGHSLDLIEENIDVTVDRVVEGKENIVKAEKHSRWGRNLLCILLLIILAIVAVIAIILVVLKVVKII
ncbi:hypothetical protein ABK040_008517 [Willaertia magna]